MATNLYWSSAQTTIFAGPTPPATPSPFWLDNSVSPYVLNLWLDAPDFLYSPLGTVDPVTNQFTPSGSSGSSGVTYVQSATAPTDTGQIWIDTGAGTPNARPVMHHIGGSWVQVGWYDPSSGAFASYAPELNDSYQTGSLASVMNPQEGDKAWLTASSVWTEHLFLNGNWIATGASYDTISGSFMGGGSSGAIVDEVQSATALPAAGGPEDITWLLAGSAPNRTWAEHIQLGGSWVSTGRVYSEASGGFLATPSPVGVAVFHQEEPRGNGGGDVVHGAWRDRPLNKTQFNGLTGVTLNAATGVITITASVPRTFAVDATGAIGFYDTTALRARHHQLRIVTGGGVGTQQVIGHSHYDENQPGTVNLGANDYALLNGALTVPAGTTSLRLQHALSWAPDNNQSEWGTDVGGGFDALGFTALGGPEVFASLKLTEIG